MCANHGVMPVGSNDYIYVYFPTEFAHMSSHAKHVFQMCKLATETWAKPAHWNLYRNTQRSKKRREGGKTCKSMK